MILDVIVKKSDDGFTAEIPSIKGCESWAHDEETVLDKIIELASFYLKTKTNKFKLDKARVKSNISVYKLVFDKT
jgi:predicted RNase H-like HicB family nuclease